MVWDTFLIFFSELFTFLQIEHRKKSSNILKKRKLILYECRGTAFVLHSIYCRLVCCFGEMALFMLEQLSAENLVIRFLF